MEINNNFCFVLTIANCLFIQILKQSNSKQNRAIERENNRFVNGITI